MQNAARAVDLNDMPYAFGVRYDARKAEVGVSESTLGQICDVLENRAEDAPCVCLLTGSAGSGRSAHAHKIARIYDEDSLLGSSYFFCSTDIARCHWRILFSTIARDIADQNPQYETVLWEAIRDNRSLRTTMSPWEQIKRFIIRPGAYLDAGSPLIIVIDGLDESGNVDDRRELLDVLSNHVVEQKFPARLRFLISTRPEPDILNALPSGPQVVRIHLDDEDMTDKVN